MAFSLPDTVEEIRKKAREFALREFTQEVADKCDREELYPKETQKKLYASGIIDISNPWSIVVTMEEFCRVDPGMGLASLVSSFGSEVLLIFGSDYQKKKYLEPVLKGEKISGFAVTEPVAGSDVAGIATRLEQKGDKWILNGGKMFITNGGVADHLYVLARSSPISKEKRHHGLTLVIVESSMKGFSSTKITGKMGMRATDTAELKFENIEVPKENIIGEVGNGFYYVMAFFNISRIPVAAQATGTAQGALDRLTSYLEKCRTENKEIYDYESTKFILAEMSTRIEAARLLTYRAAERLFNFDPDPTFTSMAKYFAAEAATYCVNSALEFMGLDGVTTDLERLYRDAKITEIWEGTTEIEKLVISRMLMKKEAGK